MELIKTETVKNLGLTFQRGVVAGIPIAIGYFPIAVTFGLLARTTGVPDYTTVLMSFIVFAGASQFIAVNLLGMGASILEIIITTFILNFRHFLMSASFSQKIEAGVSKKWLALLSFGITDETFMVNSLRKETKLPATFILGVNLIGFSSWNLGTWAGVFLGTGLPDSLKASMGIALYSMFIGLLIPAIKKSHAYGLIAALSMVISSAIYYLSPFKISSGWIIVITTIVASLVGAGVFPKEKEDE